MKTIMIKRTQLSRIDTSTLCPMCGRAKMWNQKFCKRCSRRCRCLRCGHKWRPYNRKNYKGTPQKCPNCHSRIWNRPRSRDEQVKLFQYRIQESCRVKNE